MVLAFDYLLLASIPFATASTLSCSGTALAFDEKPCLSGLVSDERFFRKCDAPTIVALLQKAFYNLGSNPYFFTDNYYRHLNEINNTSRDLGYTAPNIKVANDVLYGNVDRGGCPWGFQYELQLITKTLSYSKAQLALEVMCDAAEQVAVRDADITDWTDIDRRLTPEFLDEYTDGGTDLNNQIGNFQNLDRYSDPRFNKYYPTDSFSYTMGVSIDSYYKTGARTTALKSVDHLTNCKNQAIMCCFGGDRQYDDNHGNCAKTNCDDAKPTDNTDICYAGGRRYRGPETAHCHGFAWSSNKDDASNKMRFNNFFYVLMHDHMYSRGYVRSVKYGAPMCRCLEEMPVVSRADCSEISLESSYKMSVDSNGDLRIDVHLLNFVFNACQGYHPGTKIAKNNDLLGRIEKLYQEKKMDVATRRLASRTLVQNCETAGYRD